MKSKMNLRLDLNMVNTILMCIILIVVIIACVRKYRENFTVCHIPCNSDGTGTWDEGTKGFKCGGPECADVNSYGAGDGDESGFIGLDDMDSVSKGWADNTVEGPMDQVKLAAAVLYKQYKINLIKYDADTDFEASNEYKNLINENYLNMLKNIGFKDAKIEDSESKHTSYLEQWIKRAPIDLYNEGGINKAEYDAAVVEEGEDQTSVKLDFVDDYAITNALLLIILNGVPVPTTSA
jgi:hypothetical protein